MDRQEWELVACKTQAKTFLLCTLDKDQTATFIEK